MAILQRPPLFCLAHQPVSLFWRGEGGEVDWGLCSVRAVHIMAYDIKGPSLRLCGGKSFKAPSWEGGSLPQSTL